ncbi:MAG: FMN-binding negative transcriptional regulator [Pseudomonadota bacterium]
MHIHPKHALPETGALALLAKRGFGTFVLHTSEGLRAAPVPFLVDSVPGGWRLEFHIARGNPMAAALKAPAPGLMMCTGANAYSSPDWYEMPDQVPTWMYEAVEVTGQAQLMHPDETANHLDRLSTHFEAKLAPKPIWTTSKMTRRAYDAMLRGLIGVEMLVSELRGVRKTAAHKPIAAQVAVAGHMSATGRARDVEMAALLMPVEELAG